jgi:hypothetical protein
MMTSRPCNKFYGWVRRKISEQGHSVETKIKMSKSSKGKPKTKKHAENIRKNHVGSLGFSHTKESREKISSARLGTKLSEETKAKMRLAQQKRDKSKTGYGR